MTRRRDFLSRLVTGAIAVAVAPAVYVAARFLGPVRAAPASATIPPSELPEPGGTRPLKLGTRDALLVRDASGGLVAFSLLCTHMACNVNWRPDRRTFHCPCHNGLFDANGSVVSGPPKRPLDRLTIEQLPGGAVRITDVAS